MTDDLKLSDDVLPLALDRIQAAIEGQKLITAKLVVDAIGLHDALEQHVPG
ncbi:hypothetical protein ACQZ6F_28635 [Rhizobium sp. A22-96]